MVQRQFHAGKRGPDPVPRLELGLRRRLFRHDPLVRPSPVQGEGACRPALPLAEISAHRSRLRPAEDVRAHRRIVRAQPASARPRRRLLGRPAHQPRREGGRGRQSRPSRAEYRARMHAAAVRAARQVVQGRHPRRDPVAPPRAAGIAHAARQDAQLPEHGRRQPGSAEHRSGSLGGAARYQRQSLRGHGLEHLHRARRRSVHAAREIRAAGREPADRDRSRQVRRHSAARGRSRSLRRLQRRRGFPHLDVAVHLSGDQGERRRYRTEGAGLGTGDAQAHRRLSALCRFRFRRSVSQALRRGDGSKGVSSVLRERAP